MRPIQSLIKLWPPLLAALFLAGPAPAMADPCCTITDIDTKNGVVSARETTTDRQFKFSLTNAVLVHRIKVGQGVQADFAAGKVTVVGIDGRYPIIDTAPAATGVKAPSTGAQGSLPARNTRPAAAANTICCTITAVDPRSGMVSARDNATGRNFKFVANNEKTPLKGLKPGQGVYAHFASKQVSLDGRSACCHITQLPPASTDLGQGGFDQGSAPSGAFDQGSAQQGGYGAGGGQLQGGAGGGYGAGQGGFDPGSAQQGGYGSGQVGYGAGGGQLQGDRPWYEKEQGTDYGPSQQGGFGPGQPGGFNQGSGPWQGGGANPNPTGTPAPR
jgi:hypothetical protein